MLQQISKLSILAVAVFAFVGLQTAQAQSIGYTNQELLLANMPQMEQVNQELEQVVMEIQQEFQQEQQEFQEEVEQFQSQQSLLSPERREAREQELMQRQAELQQRGQEHERRIAQRERELIEPLLDEMRQAIDEVASERNLDMVVRSQALLYVDNNSVTDITEAVASRLGIEVDEDVAPEDIPGTPGMDQQPPQ